MICNEAGFSADRESGSGGTSKEGSLVLSLHLEYLKVSQCCRLKTDHSIKRRHPNPSQYKFVPMHMHVLWFVWRGGAPVTAVQGSWRPPLVSSPGMLPTSSVSGSLVGWELI